MHYWPWVTCTFKRLFTVAETALYKIMVISVAFFAVLSYNSDTSSQATVKPCLNSIPR